MYYGDGDRIVTIIKEYGWFNFVKIRFDDGIERVVEKGMLSEECKKLGELDRLILGLGEESKKKDV
jgi:hypothetical protein